MNEELESAAEQEVIDAWTLFQIALTRRGPYPMKELTLLFNAVEAYASVMADSPYLHKSIASNISGLCDFLELERKRVPGAALALASRIETLFLAGYDPHFEGDEPPGL